MIFTEWAANDDVFRTEFLNGIVFVSISNQRPVLSEVADALRQNWRKISA